MKMSHIDTENENNSSIFLFSKIYAFSKFWTDFVNWIVEFRQQGKIVLLSMLRKEINALF